MKILHFDCIGGISGNMIIGALLDLGISVSNFKNELYKINISDWKLQRQKIIRNGINTTKIDFNVKTNNHRRSLEEIIKVIQKSGLKKQIKNKACAIFHSIGKAEANIHNKTANKIHLHELGGEDTILDVAGALILLDMLKVERIYSSELPLGGGRIRCAHGLLPLPAPATVELLKGIPVYGVKTNKELVTPTGAAIIRNITKSFGPIPRMKILKIGYGSGNYKIKHLENFLRIFLGEKHND